MGFITVKYYPFRLGICLFNNQPYPAHLVLFVNVLKFIRRIQTNFINAHRAFDPIKPIKTIVVFSVATEIRHAIKSIET